MRKTVDELANELAIAHREEDPDLQIFQAPSSDEIRLVEVSKALLPSIPPEVMAFRFNAQPDAGIWCNSVVVLLNPVEWESVKNGDLQLPEGWDHQNLRLLRGQ